MDDDFGVVKEEIVEEDCPLPCFNGRVVSWLVSAGIIYVGKLLTAKQHIYLPCVELFVWIFEKSHNNCEFQFPDGGSVLSDADTGSQCGQSDALSSLPPGENLLHRLSVKSVLLTF